MGLRPFGELALRLNGSDLVTVRADGVFLFSSPVSAGGSYAVDVATQPAGQTCTVSKGTAVSSVDVSDVSVVCRSAGLQIVAGTLGALYEHAYFDGAAESLRLEPISAAIDSKGNVFFTDRVGLLRKLSVDGVVSTFAGAPSPAGAVDGVGREASFQYPGDVAVDKDDNIYVADGCAVRKVSPQAEVSTLAGSVGECGAATDGLGADARFFGRIGGLAVDAAGNVFAGDGGQTSERYFVGSIRRISPDGRVTTVAGGSPGFNDGSGKSAGLVAVGNMAFDPSGNLYFIDSYSVRVLSAGGAVRTLAYHQWITDGPGGGVPTNEFRVLHGIAVARDGALLLSATGLYNGFPEPPRRILRMTLEGSISPLPYSEGSVNYASKLIADASGNVHVVDLESDLGGRTPAYGYIKKIGVGGVMRTEAGAQPPHTGSADGDLRSASFNMPGAVVVDDAGNLFVADIRNHTIRRIARDGSVSTVAGSAWVDGTADGTGAAARFGGVASMAIDKAGNVYVGDKGPDEVWRLRKVSPAGVVSTIAGGGTSAEEDGDGGPQVARFYSIAALCVDGAGNVYVGEGRPINAPGHGGAVVRKVTPTGTVSTLAGRSGEAGYADGGGDAARFASPESLAADMAGNVYVADTLNQTIRKIAPDGTVSTFAGVAGQPGRVDGVGAQALFVAPMRIAVDKTNNLYVFEGREAFALDRNVEQTVYEERSLGNANHAPAIRRITPSGAVSTYAFGQFPYFGVATGNAPSFSERAAGLAVGANGDLYLTMENAILSYAPAPK
ncbi:hypothetical protein [Niveibacterium umoris]|nr:hypothetical protein [Niveibacterium umoris]